MALTRRSLFKGVLATIVTAAVPKPQPVIIEASPNTRLYITDDEINKAIKRLGFSPEPYYLVVHPKLVDAATFVFPGVRIVAASY